MPAEGNGKPIRYKVTFTGSVGQEIKSLYANAKDIGLGKEYLEALSLAIYRLSHDPWGFGEMTGRLNHAKWTIHVRVVKPLLIEFAIHEESPTVFIKRVKLML
jgi:hypothetical protein